MCTELQLSAAEQRIDDLKIYAASLPTHGDLQSTLAYTDRSAQEVRSTLLEACGKLQNECESRASLERRIKKCEETVKKREDALTRVIHNQNSKLDNAIQKQWQAIKNLEELVRSVQNESGVHPSCGDRTNTFLISCSPVVLRPTLTSPAQKHAAPPGNRHLESNPPAVDASREGSCTPPLPVSPAGCPKPRTGEHEATEAGLGFLLSKRRPGCRAFSASCPNLRSLHRSRCARSTSPCIVFHGTDFCNSPGVSLCSRTCCRNDPQANGREHFLCGREALPPMRETHHHAVVSTCKIREEHDEALQNLRQRILKTQQDELITQNEPGVDGNSLAHLNQVKSIRNGKVDSSTLDVAPKQLAANDASLGAQHPAARVNSQRSAAADRKIVGYLKQVTKHLVPLHEFEKLEAEFGTCTRKLREAMARLEEKHLVLSRTLQSNVRVQLSSISKALQKECLRAHAVPLRSLQHQCRTLACDVGELKCIIQPFPHRERRSEDHSPLASKSSRDVVAATQPETSGVTTRLLRKTSDGVSTCLWSVDSPAPLSEEERHDVEPGSGRNRTRRPPVKQQNVSSAVSRDKQYPTFRGGRQLLTRKSLIAPRIEETPVTFPCVVQQVVRLQGRLKRTEDRMHELQRAHESCVAALEERRSETAELQVALEATGNKFAQELTACRTDIMQAASSDQARALRGVQQLLAETMGKCLRAHCQNQSEMLIKLYRFQKVAEERSARYAQELKHVEEELAHLKTLGDRVAKQCEEAIAKTERVCDETLTQQEDRQMTQNQMHRDQQQLQRSLRQLAEECRGDSHHLKAEQIHTRTELQAALVDFRILREEQHDQRAQLKQLHERCTAVAPFEGTVAKLALEVERLKAERQELRFVETRRLQERIEYLELSVEELLNLSLPAQSRRSAVEALKAYSAFISSPNKGPLPELFKRGQVAKRQICKQPEQRHSLEQLRAAEASRQVLPATGRGQATANDAICSKTGVGRWIWRSGTRCSAPEGVRNMCLKALAFLKLNRQGTTDGNRSAGDSASTCTPLSGRCHDLMVCGKGSHVHESESSGATARAPVCGANSEEDEARVSFVVWNGEAMNNCLEMFHWQQGTQFVDILSPGLYEVVVGIFGHVTSSHWKCDSATSDESPRTKETSFVQREACAASEASIGGRPADQIPRAFHGESQRRCSGVFLVINETCVIKASASVVEINNLCAPQFIAPNMVKGGSQAAKLPHGRQADEPRRSACLSPNKNAFLRGKTRLDSCDIYSDWSTSAATREGDSTAVGTCDENSRPLEGVSSSTGRKLVGGPTEPVLVPDVLHTFLLLPAKARVAVAIADVPVCGHPSDETRQNLEGSFFRGEASRQGCSSADSRLHPLVNGAGFLTLRKL
ncbi:conserved hypothetical protein [Neospora caninum Liverpool]|uniref:Myosin heavy chain n=1 Tax=Neospora caninum (strain Liverpool) TaxID=572307 RepID=F0VPF2_NEOCL|nr:conserved hypothetical protein [Neospora caninum Liverpool]CBZ55598.1 conserved hypothetical protein [Neospora caninum Liverpool]CEL70340.1 TPA: hypothetical protein BN1204_060230 [Neospora caninum Liverpool]|eukprot:XP_003885626.1 conserved hypothetical protein [Neospora caninum Liverpool]